METSGTLLLSTDCVGETFDFLDEIGDDGYTATAAQLTCAVNVMYAACEGWHVTWNEYYDCFG